MDAPHAVNVLPRLGGSIPSAPTMIQVRSVVGRLALNQTTEVRFLSPGTISIEVAVESTQTRKGTYV